MIKSGLKNWRKFIFIFLCLILFLNACEEAKKESNEPVEKSIQKSVVSYAKGFSIDYYDGYKVIQLKSPWKGEKKPIKYILYQNKKPSNIDGIFIKTPIKTIACLSLTHIAFLEKLGLQTTIVGISGCNYVSSAAILKQIASKNTIEIGQNEVLNYELLVNLKPDVVMSFGIDASSNQKLNKLKTLGLTPVLNAEYMETHPLGQAEWIKFMAAFYNKEAKADSIFKNIEKEYLQLVEIAKKVTTKPTVFTGMPWSGAWYVPGGKSFQAQLFKDAGANYLWANNSEERSFIKSKEVILNEAINADFWINVNAYNSINQIIASDEMLKNFKALKQKQVYNNNLRENENSGNDYWESGIANPQLILKDLIEIFHPELIEHELYYYKKLE